METIFSIFLLKKHYGNEYKIADSYLQKLENWPAMRDEDGKQIESLSLFLTTCLNNMDELTSLNQLNSPKELMLIIQKLPYKFREKWRTYAHNIAENGQRIVFKHLVKFVERQSSIINMPIFCDIKGEGYKKKTNFVNFGKSLSTKTEPYTSVYVPNNNLNCMFCKKTNHKLDSCIFFMKKSREERLNYLKENNMCFACLCIGHRSQGCQNKLTCAKCKKYGHPTCLHIDNFKLNEPKKENEYQIKNRKTKCTELSVKTSCAVVPVKIKVKGKDNFVITYMALDNHSTDCFIDEKLLTVLKVNGERRNINLTTMGKDHCKYPTQVINNLEIYNLNGDECSVIPVAYSTKNWPFTADDVPKQEDIKDLPYLNEINFNFVNADIGLLVGSNLPSIIKPLKIVDRGENEPYASLHKHGYALNGPLMVSGQLKRSLRLKIDNSADIDNQIKQYFAQDCMGEDDDEMGLSREDVRWNEKVILSTRQLENGHIEIGLPFRNDMVHFPNNRDQALSRLHNMKNKLQRDKNYADEYSKFMEGMVTKGFAEQVPVTEIYANNECNFNQGKIWYLVHHGVMHPRKNKLRVVFDCSLKYKGKALNDELLQGPDLSNNLLNVLLKFRLNKIGITADIEQMFYQVKVPPSETDYLRFLWFPNGDFSKPPVDYKLNVHVFGATSSPSCSNYALKHCVDFVDKSQYSDKCVEAINGSFYVDDLLVSVNDSVHGECLVSEVQNVIGQSGFILKDYCSNSKEFLKSVPAHKLSKKLNNDILNLGEDKALGVQWHLEYDTLGYSINIPDKPLTKRGILSSTFSIYDPFGFANPVILPAKKLFQSACHSNLDWDAELPYEIKSAWLKWLEEIKTLKNFAVPRCLIPSNDVHDTQLHVFSDGSETGYGSSAYLRVTDGSGGNSHHTYYGKVTVGTSRQDFVKYHSAH